MRVKGWENFQHYKDRSPPWIKLHKTLLDNYEFQSLPLASRALAPMLWLLASESNDGIIDADVAKLAFRLRRPEEEIVSGLLPLIEKGFIVDDSNVLAGCKRDAMPETEREGEGEKRKTSCASDEGASAKSVYSAAFLAFYELYPRKKNKGDAAKAFKKVNPTEYPAVKAGLLAAIASDDWKRDPQFIPYPASWLNARGWEDDHEGNAKLGGGVQKPWYISWSQIEAKGAEKGIIQTRDLWGPTLKDAIFKAYGITSEMEARAIAEWKDKK